MPLQRQPSRLYGRRKLHTWVPSAARALSRAYLGGEISSARRISLWALVVEAPAIQATQVSRRRLHMQRHGICHTCKFYKGASCTERLMQACCHWHFAQTYVILLSVHCITSRCSNLPHAPACHAASPLMRVIKVVPSLAFVSCGKAPLADPYILVTLGV